MAVLALLIAFSSGTVMAAVAGARRGATAVDRLVARTLPTTIVVLPNQPGFDWEPVRRLPEVAALTEFVVAGYQIDELAKIDPQAGGFPPGDDQFMRTIERPVVLQGRVPDPTRADEVVVSPRLVSRIHKGVGDHLTLRLPTPEQVDTAITSGDNVGAPAGTVIRATIVGVVRSPWLSDSADSPAGLVQPSAGLFASAPDAFLGSSGQYGYINALVRLRDGESGIPAFKADLARVAGRPDIEVWDRADATRHGRDVTDFEARSLLAFALAAAIAAVFLVGQAIARHTASSVVDLEVLRAIGMTRDEARVSAAVGPTAAAIVGGLLGVGAAIVASRWFPIGTAATVEPNPGIQVDVAVVLVGFLVVVATVAVGTLTVATLALRARSGPDRVSKVAAAAVRAHLPVPVVVGTRFAFESGRGRQSVPTRPAVLGAVVGVLGTIAALTFAAGVHDASTHLDRFGVTYDLGGFLGENGQDFTPTDSLMPGLAADPDVAAVNDTRTNPGQVGDVAVDVFSFAPVDRPMRTVLVDGRMPARPGEIVLAPRTAKALHAATGDTITMAGTRGTEQLHVSGIGFVPIGPHNDYATGAWVGNDTYDQLFDGFKFHFVILALRPGRSAEATAARLKDSTGTNFDGATPPQEIGELREVQGMPLFLAGFLTLLALGAVGHALATAVRRRRRDLAVLRALGFTRPQSRVVVLAQASLLAIAGLCIGVPLGLALGRTLWRSVATTTPVEYHPPLALLAMVLIAPVALAAANALAAWPSQRAARLEVHQVLRAE